MGFHHEGCGFQRERHASLASRVRESRALIQTRTGLLQQFWLRFVSQTSHNNNPSRAILSRGRTNARATLMRGIRLLLWLGIALLGALALATIALHRGEQINALWLVTAALCTYALGYRF